jgi:hypothetical protein
VTTEATILEALVAMLPPAQPCRICKSVDPGTERVLLIAPRLGECEDSTRRRPAAIFECRLCGATREEVLR